MLKKRLLATFFQKKKSVENYSIPAAPISDEAKGYIRRLPKAEIHLHFEGTIGAEALLRMGRKYGVDEIKTRSDAEWLLYFAHPQMFFQNFLFVSSLLRDAEDFYEAALELGRRFAEENIRYAEITIAPHKFMRAGVPYPQILEAIDAGLRESPQSARRDYRYIIDIVRDLGPEIGMEMAQTDFRP